MYYYVIVSVLEFSTIYGGQETSRKRIVVPARQTGNRFLGSLKGLQIRVQNTKAGGVNSLESISWLLKSLKIPALCLSKAGGGSLKNSFFIHQYMLCSMIRYKIIVGMVLLVQYGMIYSEFRYGKRI